MTAQQQPPVPDAVAGVLAADLVAIIGYLADGGEPPAGSEPHAGQAPGVVGVRLSGAAADIDAAVAALAAVFEVLNRTGPRPSRRDRGQRVYLTIRTAPARPAGAGPGA